MATMVNGGPIAADDSERQTLNQLETALQQDTTHAVSKFIGPRGEEILLPESVLAVLRQLVHYLTENKAVTVVPINKALTTQEAADILNVSRPYLIKLLEDGAIPFSKVGTHRRIQLNELMMHKRQRDAERERALDQLTALNQEMGLYHA